MRTVIIYRFPLGLISVLLIGFLPTLKAQPDHGRREVFASVGWGHLFRFEDRTFGDEPILGGGVAYRPGKLGTRR